MLAMHYAFVLDDDYDMSTIRARVAEKGPRYDGYPGLVFKAFVMTERGEWRRGEPARNLYGAFYVWQDDLAATRFLESDDFAAVSQAFGRPEVLTWMTVDSLVPDSLGTRPRVASLERYYLPRETRPLDALGITGGLRGLSGEPLGGFVGLEPRSWEAVRIGLWSDAEAIPQTAGKARRFEVLRVSATGNAAAKTPTAEISAVGGPTLVATG